MTESGLLSIRIFLTKIILKNGLKKYLWLISVLKIIPWMCKIKNFNRKKIIGSFYEKELLLWELQMTYYPQPDSHLIIKLK